MKTGLAPRIMCTWRSCLFLFTKRSPFICVYNGRCHTNFLFRALEVYQNHGVEMSKILESQKSESGEESLRGQLRYDNTCIFWIQADKQGT